MTINFNLKKLFPTYIKKIILLIMFRGRANKPKTQFKKKKVYEICKIFIIFFCKNLNFLILTNQFTFLNL